MSVALALLALVAASMRLGWILHRRRTRRIAAQLREARRRIARDQRRGELLTATYPIR